MKNIIAAMFTVSMFFSILTQSVFAEDYVHVIVDGFIPKFEQPPIIEDGNTLVPLRTIFEKLGAQINWDMETQNVTVIKDKKVLFLAIGEKEVNTGTVKDNGQIFHEKDTITLEVPPKIVNGSTMVPLRFASESLGSTVVWDGRTKSAFIYSDPKDPNIQRLLSSIETQKQVEADAAKKQSATNNPAKNNQQQPEQEKPKQEKPKQEKPKQESISNDPIDKNGKQLSIGDRVKFSFFYGEVQKVNGGKVLVLWDSRDSLWVKDKDVDYMAMLAGIRYKSSQWMNANEIEIDQ